MFSNIANQLTFLRIILIPAFVLVYYSGWGYWAFFFSAAVFGAAAITDWADGYIARKYGLATKFGAFLDPVADKLMVAVALSVLIETHGDMWFTLPASVIICREIVISALREWMAEIGARANVKVSFIGKVKTTMQIISIVVVLLFPPVFEFQNIKWLAQFVWFMNKVGYVALYGAAVMTLWSMFKYLRAAWPSLSEDSAN